MFMLYLKVFNYKGLIYMVSAIGAAIRCQGPGVVIAFLLK